MSIKPEQFLAEALQNGDKSAYEQLYFNLFDGATAYLSKTFQLSKNDAYDIVSSVFVKLPEIIDKYDSTRDFLKWFHTVVNNSAKDYIKKESRSFPVEPEVLLQYVKDDEFDNVKDFERIERETRLHQIIAELSDKQFIAVTLHYLQGCTIAETAEQMEIKPETVKEYLARAKKAITKRVKTEGDHTHWLGGLIPKIGVEISSNFQYFTNIGIEAKAAVVTIAAAAIVSGVVVPSQINFINTNSLKYIASQKEIADATPATQQINPTPIEQGQAEIRQVSISEIQEDSNTSSNELNSVNPQIESRPESNEYRDNLRSQEVSLETASEAVIPDITDKNPDEKTQTKIYYITDDNGNVKYTIEEFYDENDNLIRVDRNGITTFKLIGAIALPRQPSGMDNNEPSAASDEEVGEPDADDVLDADDSSDNDTEPIKLDKSLLGGQDCKLTDLKIVFDEYGNRYIRIKKNEEVNNPNIGEAADSDDCIDDGTGIIGTEKSLLGSEDYELEGFKVVRDENGNRTDNLNNNSNDIQIQNNISSFQNTEESEITVLDFTNDEPIESDFEPQENAPEFEGSIETAKLPQDVESSLPPDEQSDG